MREEKTTSYEEIAPRIFSNYFCNDDPLIKKTFESFFKDYEISYSPKDLFVLAVLSSDNSLKLELYSMHGGGLCYRKLNLPGKFYTTFLSETYGGVNIIDAKQPSYNS